MMNFTRLVSWKNCNMGGVFYRYLTEMIDILVKEKKQIKKVWMI